MLEKYASSHFLPREARSPDTTLATGGTYSPGRQHMKHFCPKKSLTKGREASIFAAAVPKWRNW